MGGNCLGPTPAPAPVLGPALTSEVSEVPSAADAADATVVVLSKWELKPTADDATAVGATGIAYGLVDIL